MDENISISWIDYIKKKYNIPYLEHIIYLFLLSLICSIIIYLSLNFPIFHSTIIIFIVLSIAIFIINNYYKNIYQDKVDSIKIKMEKINKLVESLNNS
jgi:ABC-type multidrug transport system fused ATPase/permease subunit